LFDVDGQVLYEAQTRPSGRQDRRQQGLAGQVVRNGQDVLPLVVERPEECGRFLVLKKMIARPYPELHC
jgi:hypothetical protein